MKPPTIQEVEQLAKYQKLPDEFEIHLDDIDAFKATKKELDENMKKLKEFTDIMIKKYGYKVINYKPLEFHGLTIWKFVRVDNYVYRAAGN